jgi:hypothetical protein
MGKGEKVTCAYPFVAFTMVLSMRGGSVAFLMIAGAVVMGCGPSLKTLVESDMRFEHCYRIDEDPSTPIPQKHACWADWTARYTRGQDRSRVRYAKDRMAVLGGAAAAPPPAPTAVACPTPSSPYSPPPAVVGTDSKSAAAPSVKPAGQACTDACSQAWKVCISPCGNGAGCFEACDTHFKGCMKACF